MSAGMDAAAAGAAQGLTVGEFGTPVKDVPKHLVRAGGRGEVQGAFAFCTAAICGLRTFSLAHR